MWVYQGNPKIPTCTSLSFKVKEFHIHFIYIFRNTHVAIEIILFEAQISIKYAFTFKYTHGVLRENLTNLKPRNT